VIFGKDDNEYFRQRNLNGHISIDAVKISDYFRNKAWTVEVYPYGVGLEWYAGATRLSGI
jgi:hypothetical protein